MLSALAIASSGAAAEQEHPASGESAEAPSGVEVIHVRGRAAAAIEPDVPSSVSQFDASTIQALGAQNIADLSRVTPNVTINQPGATQATFFVRGIGLNDFSSNAAGAVTIFQDGVALDPPAIQTGSLFDIEAVEVVRGPQGTGPYRNASAGAFRVKSRRPSGNYGGQLRASLGRYDTIGDKGAVDGALFQDYEGAVEMPVVPDAISARFAFRLRDAEPYKRNGCGNKIPFSQRPVREQFPGRPPGTVPVQLAAICGEREGDRSGGGMIPFGMTSQIPYGLPGKVNDQHNWAARGTLRFQPRDSGLDVLLSGHGSRLDQDSALGQAMGIGETPGVPGFFLGGRVASNYQEPDQAAELAILCGPVLSTGCTNREAGFELGKNLASRRPLDKKPYRGDYDRVGKETRDAWGAYLSAEWEVADLQVSGLTSWDAYRRSQDQDIDFTPDLLFEQFGSDEAWQTYEQLSVAGELESEPLSWELGGYYLHERLHVDPTNTPIRLRSAFLRTYSQVIHSFGPWVKFDWDFVDDFTLGGGVRYNWEQKDFSYTQQQTQLGVRRDPRHLDQRRNWQTPTGELTLTYHVTERAATYLKYSRGFKAGHFNALAGEDIPPPAEEEYNDAWEVGASGSGFDGRLSGRAAFFYYKYENYQIFLFRDRVNSPPALEIDNAKQAENFGAELELRLSPLRGWAPRLFEGLQIEGTFGWLHGEYLDFQSVIERPAGGSQVLRIPIDFSGRTLQSSPPYKVSATAEWTIDLGRWGYLVPRYDMNWSDDVFFDPSEGRGNAREKGSNVPFPEFTIGQKALFLHNVRLAYRLPTLNVELAGFVRNLTDEVYKTFAFDAVSFSRVVINFPGEPRTIGGEVVVTFP